MLCLTVEDLTNVCSDDSMEVRFLQAGYDNPTISFAPIPLLSYGIPAAPKTSKQPRANSSHVHSSFLS